MEHQFPVTVVDDKGAPVTGARVCLVARSALGAARFPFEAVAATHDDKGGGTYEPKAAMTPAAGDWVLLVTLATKSPVAQPLKVTKKGPDELDVRPSPATVATVSPTTTTRVVGGSKVKEIAFQVTLHPAAELVFLAGIDYHAANPSGGWPFHEYGFGRAEALWRKKQIHAGTIVTVFSTSKIWVTTRVRRAGGSGWVDVAVAQLGDPATRTLPNRAIGETYQPVVGLDIHITDFYKYLAAVGKREAHSVKEVGIFSHSWPGGPILYDTGEAEAIASTPQRDPTDFDARAKDFNNVNFADHPEMKDALAPGCRFNVWGCSATTHFKFRSRAALKAIRAGVPEDGFFVVNSEVEEGGVELETVEERTSELRHRFEMDQLFRRSTYIAEAAMRLAVDCRSACPGCGSDPTTVDGIEMLGVDLGTYSDVYAYFHAKFSPEFKETNEKWDHGYVDYHALQGRAPVARPPFSSQHYTLTIDTGSSRFAAATPVVLAFEGGKSITHTSRNVRLETKSAPGMNDPALKGDLYILRDAHPAHSKAVYVREDGKVFKVTADAGGHFTVVGPEI